MEVGAFVFGYAMVGIVFAIVCFAIEDDVPPGSLPAIQFVVGLLWPGTFLVIAVALFWRGCSAVGEGFVVLWRHWSASRAPRIPRASARARRGGP